MIDWQWVVKGAVDVDIGANPSAEGAEDEGVDDSAVKVVDIVDTFRLQVGPFIFKNMCLVLKWNVWTKMISSPINQQEQPSFDKKQFVTYMKRYIKLLTAKLDGEKQESFKKHIEGATKFLLSKLKDLQL